MDFKAQVFEIYCWLLANRSLPGFRGSDVTMQCTLAARTAHVAAKAFEKVCADFEAHPELYEQAGKIWDGWVGLEDLRARGRPEYEQREMASRRAGERQAGLFDGVDRETGEVRTARAGSGKRR